MKMFSVLALLASLISGGEESVKIDGKDVPCIGIERRGENPNYIYFLPTTSS